MIRLYCAGLLLFFVNGCMGDEIFPSVGPRGSYSMNYWDAQEHCASLGAHLATKDELSRVNKSICQCGWTLDRTANYPMIHNVPSCGGRRGLHNCNWRDTWDAFCYRGGQSAHCSRPLGIESEDIHASQLYASSEFHHWYPLFQNSKWKASIARLNNKDLVNAWMPKYDGRNQWLQVDLDEPMAVTGIVTQGASRLGKAMWVQSYTIHYSKDGINFKYITESNGYEEKVFDGNVNNNGYKRNMFPEAVLARYIRFIPRRYHRHIALRLELLGCDLTTYIDGDSSQQTTTAALVKKVTEDPFREFPPEPLFSDNA